MHRLYLLLLIISGFIFQSCQNDDHNECLEYHSGIFQEQFDQANGSEKYDVISAYFDHITSNGLLIIKTEFIDQAILIIETEDGTRLCIPNFFYKEGAFSLNRDQLHLNLTNGQIISAPYFEKWDAILKDSLVINPYGSNPLCAAWYIEIPHSAYLNLTILGKNDESVDIQHNFGMVTDKLEIPILGLYENHANKIVVSFKSKLGSVYFQDTLNIFSEKVTTQTASIDILKRTPSAMKSGFNLVSGRLHPNYDVPYMFDEEGELRWLLDFKDHALLYNLRYDVGIERLQNGNWYFGDIKTGKIFEVGILGDLINSWDLGPYVFHHKVQEKTDGNFLVSVTNPTSVHLNGRPTNEDFIIELDRLSGTIINTWDLKQSLDEYRTVMNNNLSNPVVDWLHVNAIISDDSDGTIIISGRYQGIIKLTYDNRIVWIVAPQQGWSTNRRGENLNQYLLDPIDAHGNKITDSLVLKGYKNHPNFEWCWGQHAINKISNGNFILFDNGFKRNHQYNVKYSRIVEYDIDEINNTIQQKWSYGEALGTGGYSSIASNVEFDENTDHYFMNVGRSNDNGVGQGGRTLEVDRNTKTRIFEAAITTDISSFAFHRVNRVSLYPN